MENPKKNKLLIAAEAAFFTAEFANSNIKKYLALHGADVQKLNTYLKNDEAHYVMKIANENAHFVIGTRRKSSNDRLYTRLFSLHESRL